MDFSILLNETIKQIVVNDDSEIEFYLANDKKYKMFHNQYCCESVYIKDIVGDWEDIIDEKILLAEEVINERKEVGNNYEDWTFYKLATIKGSIDISWCGVSNGYYSTVVDFIEF